MSVKFKGNESSFSLGISRYCGSNRGAKSWKLVFIGSLELHESQILKVKDLITYKNSLCVECDIECRFEELVAQLVSGHVVSAGAQAVNHLLGEGFAVGPVPGDGRQDVGSVQPYNV